MKKIILVFALTFIVANFTFAGDPDKENPRFRFAFFTDIHLNKGWHFIVLNTANSVVDEKQKQWMYNLLQAVRFLPAGGAAPFTEQKGDT